MTETWIVSDRPSPSIQWFAHPGSLHRDSRSLRFHGEVGRGEDARTVNVAVSWEALEALETQQSEVRDHLRYSEIFEANREKLTAIAERKLARGDGLTDGYLTIGLEDL